MNFIKILTLAVAVYCGGVTYTVIGCVPQFPASYFEQIDWQAPYERFKANIIFSRIAELREIGRQYYPDWYNLKLQRNHVRTGQAHEFDFMEAAKHAGLSPEAAQTEFANYWQYKNAAEVAVVNKTALPALPENIPSAFLEFYLYTLGRGQYMLKLENTAPEAWQKLLTLPPAQRYYRTVWVHFGQLIAVADDYVQADIKLAKFRQVLDDGYADTANLEEFAVRLLVRHNKFGLRFLPLAAAALSPDNEVLQDVNWLNRRVKNHEDLRQKLSADPMGRELLLVADSKYIDLLLKNNAPADGMTNSGTAERLAWHAFNNGDWELGEKLLTIAPQNSLFTIYMQARLARCNSDYRKSMSLLRRWLLLYQQQNVCAIETDTTETAAKNPMQLVTGEIAAMQMQSLYAATYEDFAEIMTAFGLANSYLDQCVVAELFMSVKELQRYVKELPPGENTDGLRHLLARRLMREYRPQEAVEFFPAALQDDAKLYIQLSKTANDHTIEAAERCAAFFNLAQLCVKSGMELFGTEFAPDYFCNNGNFEICRADIENLLLYQYPQPKIMPHRFHYRSRAANFAWRGALIAPDDQMKTACLWLGGLAYKQRNEDAVLAEPFYQALCDMPDSVHTINARQAGWFPAVVSKTILPQLYAPMLVLSVNQIRQLTEQIKNKYGDPTHE